MISFYAAFIAGLISFLSPCVLPLVPGFLAYLAGSETNSRTKYFLNSVFFVLGFSVIFAIIGVLLNGIFKNISITVQMWLNWIGGIIIIIFGLHLLGLIKVSFLEKGHKVKVKLKRSYITSFLFGGAFAVGWTPCVGAVLGSVLILAATQPGQSLALLLTYSLGLGLPFLFVGLFSGQAINLINRSKSFLKYFNIFVGILLIILGVLVFTNNLILVANFGWFL